MNINNDKEVADEKSFKILNKYAKFTHKCAFIQLCKEINGKLQTKF